MAVARCPLLAASIPSEVVAQIRTAASTRRLVERVFGGVEDVTDQQRELAS